MPEITRSGQKISHYAVREQIGAGGMGDVYRGVDLRLRRPVALKFLRPQADEATRERFIQEARSASRLDHPNICTIYEVGGTPDGAIFIAMAYYEGETLDRTLAAGPLQAKRAVSMALQAARGLAAAHEELVIHRDIKPANLMLTRTGTVKILDFGVATLLTDAAAREAGPVLGTPAYMSPEQLRGEPVDQQTDVWALGVVLYEMVTGQKPFRGAAADEVVAAILQQVPPRPSDVHPGVPLMIEHILERALAKSPRLRYERMDSLVRDLVEAQTALDSDAITRRFPATRARASIAVLPFADMTADQDQGYLCDGIAEEILRALSRIPDLHVASRTSAFQFKKRSADIREIGTRLNVRTVLEGSVRRVGNRVRISAQLINVDDGYRIWYERYDRNIEDLFSIEDEIAEEIARALRLTLSSPVTTDQGEKRPDAEAYELYLQGLQFIHQHRRQAFEIALQTFKRATEINPDYARAYAGIADCHSYLRLYFGAGPEATEAADAASRRALELGPDLADAHSARGFALFLKADFDRAALHLQRAIELDPSLYGPHYVFGRLCFEQGRIAEAAGYFSEASTLVPEAFDSWYLLGMCYRRLGQPGKGRNADFECIEAVKKTVRMHPEDTRAWTMGASVLAEMGEPDTAATWVERALAVDAGDSIIEYNAGCVYTRLGRFDDAMDHLGTAITRGGVSKEWAVQDPDLDPIREDPRFKALLT